MGVSILPSFKGTYQLVPPPGAKVAGFGFKKLKRGLKKAGRGVKKVGKKGIKVSTKGIKTVAKAGKFAMKAMAKLAARPIIKVVNQLASRRGKYLAYQRTGTTTMTRADKKAGGQYALSKLNKAGPFGKLAVKILKFTGGVTAGEVLGADVNAACCRTWRQDAAMCGMTGPEIAAASAQILNVVNQIKKMLNKPGEAPSNPAAAAKEPEPTEEVQPVVESAEDSEGETSEETAEETPEDGATEGATLEQEIEEAAKTGNRAKLKKLAAKLLRQRRASF